MKTYICSATVIGGEMIEVTAVGFAFACGMIFGVALGLVARGGDE